MWRKVLAAILDFLTVFFVGGFAVGYITGGMTPEGGFSLSGGPALVLFAVIAVYFVVFTKYLGGTLWQRVLGTMTPEIAEPGAAIHAPAIEKPARPGPLDQGTADAMLAEIPPGLDRWNWGALLLNWIWGLGNNTFIALLMFVPVVNIVMPFVLGAKGSEWAWRNKRWQSVEHFKRVQRLWAIWGVVVWIAWIGVMVAIFFAVMESLKHSEAYEMATQRLRANTEAMEVLGAPISTGYPWGSVEISGPKGRADFSFSVTGAKQKGTVYLDATKDLGRWKINRIELEVPGRADRINLADVPRRTSLDDGLAALRRGDYPTALRLLRSLADQGNAVARFNLATMYDNGRGVPLDDAEAARWYRLAAEQGHAAAQNNLAAMYRSGQGVAQDPAEAVKWFQKAADQGSTAAQTNLGAMYRNGEGVPQDFAEAVRWYRLAARQGNASAQNNLGLMYRDGRAVPQDDVRAHMWFNLSAAKGNQTAAKNRDTAAGRLTAEQLAQAQELARKCQASNYKQCD
jgi:TPR repeat protein